MQGAYLISETLQIPRSAPPTRASAPNRDTPTRSSERKCYYCKKIGHISRDCPLKKKRKETNLADAEGDSDASDVEEVDEIEFDEEDVEEIDINIAEVNVASDARDKLFNALRANRSHGIDKRRP